MIARMSKQLISVTPPAMARLRQLLLKHEKEEAAVKIGLKSKGCSGLSYAMSLIDSGFVSDKDEIVKLEDGVTLVIDSKAVMFLIGTEIDFVVEPLNARFTFNNPNQKTTCGCGKSFNV